jgi:microcystin-dependent protein
MWSSAIVDIPAGWALCDGTGGTPNLVDRFILGVSYSEEPGTTGGDNSITLAVENLPAHAHGAGSLAAASDGSHSHSVTDPGHRHQGKFSTEGEGFAGHMEFCGSEGSVTNMYGPVGFDTTGITIVSGGAHTHTISGSTGSIGSANAFDNRPAFYKLAFIIKV